MTRSLRMIGAGAALTAALIASARLLGETTPAPADANYANPPQSDPVLELARLRNEGVAQYESGIGLKKALAAFEAASRLKPKSAVDLFNLGATQRKMGNAGKAIELLTAALAIDPKLTHAAYTLGLVQRAQGSTPAAVAAFEVARKSSPADPAIHYQLGRLYRELRREPEALQSYIDALQLDPQHTGTMYQLYLYYQEHGEPDRAKAMFEEFSRVKRALSRTRKEINDDETNLARPLVVATAGAQPKATAPQLRWNVVKAISGKQVASVAVRDIDADGLDDLLIAGRDGSVSVHRNEGQARFAEVASFRPKVSGTINSIAAEILVRGETHRLLLATSAGIFVGAQDLKVPGSEFAKVSDAQADAGLSFADLDHDGDVDLIVGAFREVLMNDGAAAFRREAYLDSAAAAAVRERSGPVVAVDMLDRNGIDFVLYGESTERTLLADILGGSHVASAFAPLSAVKRVVHATAADLDNDGHVDLISAAPEGVQVDYHRDRYRFTSSALNRTTTAADGTITVGDFDNDGWKDLLALDAVAVRWWRNLGDRKFGAQEAVKMLSGAPLAAPVTTDIDRDGRLDVVVLSMSGEVEILRNQTTGIGKSVRVALNGIRSSPSGLHTIVETRRGNFYQKYVSSGTALDVPLGAGDYAEILRINWPNGFVESKFKVEGGKVWQFKESERVSGSCPSVFAWDGTQFRFITDAFISGPMGVPFGVGGYFPVDHDEYLKIPGQSLRIVDGRLRVAITEELREAVFLDQVRLLAVDHPQDTEVYPNEFLFPGVFPEFKLHLTSAARPASEAQDQAGRDVSALVSDVDRRYPSGFRRLQYEGLAEENGVEFELPPGAALAPSLRVFLTGWFHYFESTSLVAASQRSDLRVEFPRIEVLDGKNWRKILDIGIPSGKDKTVVVDLTHRLPPDARRVRVRSNLALYWDRIVVDTERPPRDVELAQVPLHSARLRFKGFSGFEAVSDQQQPQPERFVYGAMRVSAPWNPLVGFYTRYGVVSPLLNRIDSQMTVFGSGDELLLEFDARQLAPPRRGWKRDYLLHLDGFVKDGDKYTAHAGTLAPIPFAGMKNYPYETEAAPAVFETPEYRAYIEQYQTRARLRFTGPRLAPRLAPRLVQSSAEGES